MEKRTLNLRVTCKVEYTFLPAEECVSNFDLPTFLSDLHSNLEIVNLLEEGEIVVTDGYELIPFRDNLIGVSKSESGGQNQFYLSSGDLRSIAETLACYDLKERFLEIGLELENSGVASMPELNIADESQASGGDSLTFGQDSDAFCAKGATVDFPVPRPGVSEMGQCSSHGSDKPDPKNILFLSAPASETNDFLSDGLKGKTDDNILVSDHVHGSGQSFLDSAGQSDDLPPKEFNAVSTLLEHLRKVGHDSVSSLEYSPETHKTVRNPVFSNNVSFKIGHVLHSYDSCTRFARKSDAKKNVAYQACKALGLTCKTLGSTAGNNQPMLTASQPDDVDLPPKSLNVVGRLNEHLQKIGPHVLGSLKWHEMSTATPVGLLFSATVSFSIDGSTYQFSTSKHFPNKTDAKRSAAYIACKSLRLF